MVYEIITREDILNYLDKNGCTFDDVPLMLLEQLANGDTTVEELREWIIDAR